jgi:lipoate-protein ligase A
VPRLPHLRLLIGDGPQSGAWNMAVDEVLLETAIAHDLATLRFYRWREPTASLGYFQREADFQAEARYAKLPAVRRLSGGGTLIHDHELTYSLALPPSQRVITRPMELYDLVHSAFIIVLERHGIAVQQRGTTVHRQVEPLLCFAREDEHDLMLLGRKVLGSAQRRRRGAILQHGGLVLEMSLATPELPGINELCPGSELGDLEMDLASQIASMVSESYTDGRLSVEELLRVTALSSETYTSLAHPGHRSE